MLIVDQWIGCATFAGSLVGEDFKRDTRITIHLFVEKKIVLEKCDRHAADFLEAISIAISVPTPITIFKINFMAFDFARRNENTPYAFEIFFAEF